LSDDGFEARGVTHTIFTRIPVVILREALDEGDGKSIAIHIEIVTEEEMQRGGENRSTAKKSST
jgi:hypothetical protein